MAGRNDITGDRLINKRLSKEGEENWEVQVEEFSVRQAILRTKLRVQNFREEPIDFVAKVILTIFGLIPLTAEFKTQEFS